jgi:16S rRNA (cytidine1402-2'-O)-methyltransferase
VRPGSSDVAEAALAPGTLYLVATPIGNLGDMTARAIAVLRAVDWIAAEDTRHTARLLAHFGVKKPLVSAHAQREASRAKEIAARLARGQTGALVVDAGTPGISDPGARIVRAVVEAGFTVCAVPGPSAVVAALTVSGLDTAAFTFAGFLPARAGARDARLAELLARRETIVLYEAPHRVVDTLRAIDRLAPLRALAACRELTKRHEEVLRGTASAVLAQVTDENERGEWALVIEGAPAAEVAWAAKAPGATDPRRRFIAQQVAAGATAEEAQRRADFVLGAAPKGKRR